MILESISSPAKTKIIKLLIRVKEPLCLREIVSLTEVGIRSAQIALKSFKKLKLVKETKIGNMTCFNIIESDEIVEFRHFLEKETNINLQKRAAIYSKKTIKMLPVIQGLYDFSNIVKSKIK